MSPSGLRALPRAVALLFAVRLLDEATGFLAPASVEVFRTDLGLSYGAVAAVLFAAGPGSILGQLAVVASDGTTRRGTVVAGAATLSASLGVSAVATSGWMLGLGSFLLGAGATMLVHGGEIVVVANGPRPIERTLARINLGGVMGDLAGPLAVAAGRAAGLDWRTLFAGAAVVVLAYSVVLAVSPFPAARPVREPDDEDPSFRGAGVAAIGVLALLLMPLDESLLAMVLAFAEVDGGASPTTAALLGAGFVAGGVVSFTLLPDLIGRHPVHVVVGVAGVAMAVAIAAVTVLPVAAVVLAGVVVSVGLNSAWLALQSVSLRLNPGREGLTKALVEVFEVVGFAIPIAIGVVADRHGLTAALLVYAALPVLLAATAVVVRRPLVVSR